MKRCKKIIASLAAVLLFASFGCFAAYAEDVPVEPIIQEPVEDQSSIDVPDMPVEDPGSGSGDDDGGNVDDGNSGGYYDPGYNDGGGNVDDGGSGYDSGNSSYVDSGNSNYNGYNNNSGWIDGDGNVYSSPNDVYVGGGQSYNPPQSTAPSAALYEVQEKKTDDGTLSGNDWKDIASQLRNADSNPAEDDGSGDFAFIQQNTAKEDNGNWIFIAGAVCLLLSLAGFIYLIASAVSRHSRMKALTSGGNRQADYYRPDDFDDGYTAKKQKTPRNGKRYK